MQLKTSIWSHYFHGRSPEEKLKEIAGCGYRYAELSTEDGAELLTRGDPETTGARFREEAEALGIELLQGHLMLEADILNRAHVEGLKSWIALFYAAGVRNMVLHYGRYPSTTIPPEQLLRQRAEALSQLIRLLPADACICLENLGSPYDKDCAHLLRLIDALGSDQLGICLDTGHLNLCGGDPAAFVVQAGSRLRALHIADNEGFYDQHLMPYGRGTVPWERFMRALNASGYQGLFNYEIPGECQIPLELRREKLRYLLKVAGYMGSIR